MNKRIKELAEQAREHARNYVEDCKHYGYHMEINESHEYEEQFEQKFAELIVIECAKIASDSVIDHSGHSETNICPKYLACHIKDHFGVQE